MLYLPYFQTAYFCLHTVNEKYLLIFSEYFMPKPSSDSATDVIPYCSLVFLRAYMITGQIAYIQYKNNVIQRY